MVSYYRRCGDGVPGAGRPDASRPARRAVRARRPDAGALTRRSRHDAHRRRQAPPPPGGGRARRHQRRGREKLHFLNPVPIRLIHDRWVSKYTEPWAAGLTGLKQRTGAADGEGLRDLHPHDPERLWEAITDPAIRAKYHFGVSAQSDWTPGSPTPSPTPAPTARSPRARTSSSIRRAGSCRRCARCGATTPKAEGTSRVTWEIEPVGDSCRLTVTHDQLRDGAPDELYGGWPMILSGLKTWLEIGPAADHPWLPDVRQRPRKEMTMTTITDVRTIGVDRDATRTARFVLHVDTLGFEKRLDAPTSPTRAGSRSHPRSDDLDRAQRDRRRMTSAPTPVSASPGRTPRPSAPRWRIRRPCRRAAAMARRPADVRLRRSGRATASTSSRTGHDDTPVGSTSRSRAVLVRALRRVVGPMS